MEKYKDHPDYIGKDIVLPVRSNQKMNEYLKEIASLCEISELNTHKARRTFGSTVTLGNGVPIHVVKEMLGHHFVNISPSKKEILFLKTKYGEELLQQKLKEYATAVMDAYALNFKKDSITSSKDLLWFGKLEHFGYYSNTDEKVKDGEVSTGDIKEGEQMHLQIIVSRKDIPIR